MTTHAGEASLSQESRDIGPKQQFLQAYDREHDTTMRVLRAFPVDRLDLKHNDKCRATRSLARVFAAERWLGIMVFNDEFVERMESGSAPPPPEDWAELLTPIEAAHQDFRRLIESTAEDALH